MSFGSFMKNIGTRVGNGIETMAQERARRLNNPAFQETLRLSRNEFANHLSNTGSNALDGAYRLLLRGPGVTAHLIARNLFDSKTKFIDDVMPKILDEVASAGSSIGKTLFHATKLSGRGALHTLRWLFAK